MTAEPTNPRPREARFGPNVPPGWKVIESGGPRPFTSWVTYQLPDQSHYVWESRRHRKGAGPRMSYADRVGLRATSVGEDRPMRGPWTQFWAPHRLAWWIAVVFMLGSACFVAGAAGSLFPHAFGGQHSMSVFAEICYFLGAVLYTISIYGQVLESLNADDRVAPDRISHAPRRFRWFGWEVGRLEFMTPFTLLIGSLIFNYETTFALGSTVGSLPELGLWVTSLLGAMLFFVAAFLQMMEVGHAYLSFAPRDVSWWVGFLFVLGSLGFVAGALPGLSAPGLPTADEASGALIVKIGFLLGALAFLAGSYLMIPELFTRLQTHAHYTTRN